MEENVNEMEMDMKRQKAIEEEEERDRLNELPDGILLDILTCMDAKFAVRTCVLSKRWKDLWKQVTSLSFRFQCHRTIADYNKFVPLVLLNRDGSVPLLNVDMWAYDSHKLNLLDEVAEYAVSHNVQQLAITVNLIFGRFFPIIFSCQSLTSLKISITSIVSSVVLPKSLKLPALKSLELHGLSFTASDGDCAEPFSACGSLSTLVVESCTLQCDAKALRILNSNLCSLTLGNTILHGPDKVVLSTPNLRSLNVICDPIYELSAHNLSFLDRVNIDIMVKTYFHTYYFDKSCTAITRLLQVLSDYVKTLILSSSTLQILNGISERDDSMITLVPCFVQLKSLKLKSSSLSDKELSRTVEYLLRKTPMTKVDVTKC